MRLIDAEALIDDIQRYANEPIKLNDRRWDTKCVAIIMDMIGTVKSQSTIEAVPVVRCKDCANWDTDWLPAKERDIHMCDLLGVCTKADWYCAGGGRKDNDEQVDKR